MQQQHLAGHQKRSVYFRVIFLHMMKFIHSDSWVISSQLLAPHVPCSWPLSFHVWPRYYPINGFISFCHKGFIKLLKPRPRSRSSNGPEAESLLPGPSHGAATKVPHSAAFDLGLARVSLFVEVVSYTLMALAPTALAFTGFSIMASLGAGLNPALQSVSLALYRRRGGTESGKLFGALSVLQALSYVFSLPVFFDFFQTSFIL